jgi:hypothetical protein
MKDELRLALQEARLANWDIKNLSKLLQDKAAEMALAKYPMPRRQADTGICFPTDTQHQEALNRLSTGRAAWSKCRDGRGRGRL